MVPTTFNPTPQDYSVYLYMLQGQRWSFIGELRDQDQTGQARTSTSDHFGRCMPQVTHAMEAVEAADPFGSDALFTGLCYAVRFV